MKKISVVFLILLSTSGYGQTIFAVDNFSKEYYGKIQINDTSEIFSKGWVAVYERKTKKQLIKVASDELALTLHDGKALANIKSLPYGEQSLIIYEDFNFDGKNDFAISDGQNSCYHGPSFKIYLASPKGFLLSNEFTRLAQEYCGMFNVDRKEKRITTMTKSGCCWHEFSEFIVQNNKPRAIRISTVQQEIPFSIYTEEIWNGKAMVKKSVKTIDMEQEGIEVILSFKVPANGRQVILYNINDRMLNYAAVRKDSSVEFSYPDESLDQTHDFTLDSTTNDLRLTFKHKNATYRIYDRPDRVGISIEMEGKTYDWQGDLLSRKGSLDKLRKLKHENVY